MSFNVRIWGHVGLAQIPAKQRQFTADSVYQLSQPYEFAQVISVTAAAARSAPIADVSGRAVTVLFVEVPDAQKIRYEICPTGRVVDAGNSSPPLSGLNYFEFRSGWTISLIDAAGLP